MEIFEKAKKKPDTVAAVSDFEQEIICDNIPADIVAQETEIVKEESTDDIPGAVVGAVADRIDKLYDILAETNRQIQQINVRRAHIENEIIELKMFLTKNGFSDVVKVLTLDAQQKQLKEDVDNG